MRLLLNHHEITATATPQDILDGLAQMDAQRDGTLTLMHGENFMEAAGCAADGYVMQVMEDGQTVTSSNQALKQSTVITVLTAYLQGDRKWRAAVGWIGATVRRGVVVPAKFRRRARLAVLVLFLSTLAYVPMVMVTRAGLDATLFSRVCEQDGARFSHFAHGVRSISGALGLGTSNSAPTCWYVNGGNTPLETLIGDSAWLVDGVSVAIEVLLPFVILATVVFFIVRAILKGSRTA
jgi:hypothetical protein